MPISAETSSRIEILRFPLIIGVVFIHNYASTVAMAQSSIGLSQNGTWVEFIRFFISRGVAQVAVPLFFMISGYLFFLGDWSWNKYLDKLQRRVHTLLTPYLFWNCFTLAVFMVGQSLPQTHNYFTGSAFPPIRSATLLDYANALLGITTSSPIAFQFWFIRDLMALIVLAPAIHFLLARRFALPTLAALFCLWFSQKGWPVLWPTVASVFFFCLGAYLTKPGRSVTSLDRFGPLISAGFLGVLILQSAKNGSIPYLDQTVILFGVPSVWWFTQLAIQRPALKSWLMKLGAASFFVFAAHEPLLRITRKIAFTMIHPNNDVTTLALYFLIPVGLIAVLTVIHHVLLKACPAFLGIVTGSSHRPARQSA